MFAKFHFLIKSYIIDDLFNNYRYLLGSIFLMKII